MATMFGFEWHKHPIPLLKPQVEGQKTWIADDQRWMDGTIITLRADGAVWILGTINQYLTWTSTLPPWFTHFNFVLTDQST